MVMADFPRRYHQRYCLFSSSANALHQQHGFYPNPGSLI